MLTMHLRAIYRFRGFIIGNVNREFASRYRNSMLGAAWLVLQPLAQILVFTLIFTEVMKARLPGLEGSPFAYSIFLCSGVLTWGFFSEIVGRSQSMFMDNANLLKKLNFPRICLPLIIILNAVLGFAVIFGLFTGFLILSGNFPGWIFFLIIPVLSIEILFSIGLGMVLGVLNVFFRDVGQFFGFFLQFWFWLTPIVYPLSTLPEWMQNWVKMNPMTPLISAFQEILVHGKIPDWKSLLPVVFISTLLCYFGMRLFRKHSGEIVDEL
jgi:lipopolysaccharide transport system permease protein